MWSPVQTARSLRPLLASPWSAPSQATTLRTHSGSSTRALALICRRRHPRRVTRTPSPSLLPPSVPMLVGCAPCVSISGLNGMVRPHDVSTGLPLNSSSVNETQVRNSTNVLVGAAPLTYGEKHGKLCETGTSSVGFCLSGLSALHAPRAFVPALSDLSLIHI